MSNRRWSRSWLRSLLGLGAFIVLAVAAAPAQAVGPAVAWEIGQSTAPTNLIPGSVTEGSSEAKASVPRYFVTATNVGGATAEGVSVTDNLPVGVVPTNNAEYFVPGTGGGACAAPVGQTVTCAVPVDIGPGVQISIWIPIEVEAAPPSTLQNAVAVSGSNFSTASQEASSTVSTQVAPFNIAEPSSLVASAFDEGGVPARAGSHPFSVRFRVRIPTEARGGGGFREVRPVQPLRTARFELPEGLVANPTAAEKCPAAAFNAEARFPPVSCNAQSQVGRVTTPVTNSVSFVSPLYDLEPRPGAPAEFGFILSGSAVRVVGGLTGSFHVTAESREILAKFPINELYVELWGNPSDPRFASLLKGQGCGEKFQPLCTVEPYSTAFLTMPTACTAQLSLGVYATGWLGGTAAGTTSFTDLDGVPSSVSGCDGLQFEPQIETAAAPAAESPTGLDFRLHQPQDETLEGRATAALRDATVMLPSGMTLNPAAANGLSSCSEQQIGFAPEAGKIRFTTDLPSCPKAAKVGSLEVKTPLLEGPLPGGGIPGSIYVATPYQNPFGSLLAIYLAVEDEEDGIFTKLAGKVTTDPTTGQLTATFLENPQLPIEDFDLHFTGGSRGILTTPLSCGKAVTSSSLTPWSSPAGADAHPVASFDVAGGCQPSESAAPKTVAFEAGTEDPLAGAFSPFVLRLSRNDGTQHITGVETTLAGGLLGKLAGVQYCPDSGIAQAVSRERPEMGRAEQQSPSCPSSSEVGSVQVTAGSGATPIPVTGHAYLAGPYKGAPLSLVVVVPAVAGPFDLGTVVDRVALNVDEYTAQIHAVADPLPTIREGIPLDVRSIELKLNRQNFTVNPTSCEAKQIEGQVFTQAGQAQPIINRFQVGECARLAFKPTLKLSLKGATGKTGHPALKAVVTYPKAGEYANIARAQVNLPHSEFLDQGNIAKACTKVLLSERACPAKSIYGYAKAWSPLLESPLEGPVYLVGGYGYKLPALVSELNGQIRVLLVGKTDSGKNQGIRNTFETVPDAPVSRFVLRLKGGKNYGLLENSEDLCRKPQKAGAVFRAQNGRAKKVFVKIANSCGKTKGSKKVRGADDRG